MEDEIALSLAHYLSSILYVPKPALLQEVRGSAVLALCELEG